MFRKLVVISLFFIQAVFLAGCVSLEAYKTEKDMAAFNEFLQKNIALAEQGDVSKQLNLANMYLHASMPAAMESEFNAESGLTPPYRFRINVNREAALYFFEKAARQNNIEAKQTYALLALRGYDETRYAYALELLQELAEAGDSGAQAYLGFHYAAGEHGIKRDVKKAKQLFEQAPDEPFTKLGLAFLYENGWGVKSDSKKAMSLTREVANAGLYEGMTVLAQRLAGIDEANKDPQQAVEWAAKAYQSSLMNGEPDIVSVLTLSYIVFMNPAFDYDYGDLAREGLETIVSMYNGKFEAEASWSISNFAINNRLGWSWGDGIRTLSRAAELGQPAAVETFDKFKKDVLASKTKAEQGDTKSQIFLMNYFYAVGDNLNPDPHRAIYYANKLAANNNTQGLMFLANMHMQGVYLPKDQSKILYYIQTAANLSDPEAIRWMNAYQVFMQQRQLQMQQQIYQAQQNLIDEQRQYIRNKQWQDTMNSINNMRPKRTNCYKMGNYVNCTTY